MKAYYEQPEAEIISFQAQEKLAVIEESAKDPDAGVVSRDI